MILRGYVLERNGRGNYWLYRNDASVGGSINRDGNRSAPWCVYVDTDRQPGDSQHKTLREAFEAAVKKLEEIGGMPEFWCPLCGQGASSDEDRCCTECGATLIDPDVFGAIHRLGAAEEREACAAYLDRQQEAELAESTECRENGCHVWARDYRARSDAAKDWAKAIRSRPTRARGGES